MTFRCAFLIPTKHRHTCLARTLASVERAARRVGAEIVVCDQSPEPFPGYGAVRVLHRPELGGLPAARNALLAATDAEVVCFLDDDTDLAADFAERLRELAVREPGTVAWGPVVEARSRWVRRLHRLSQFGVFRDLRRLTAGRCDRQAGALFGCCFAVRRAWAERIGFDARRPGYALGEDLDFFLRLGEALRAARRGQAALGMVRFARCLRAHHRRDGADRASPFNRGLAKARFLLWLARRHGGRNPCSLFHLAVALTVAALGRGQEPASWRGVIAGLTSRA